MGTHQAFPGCLGVDPLLAGRPTEGREPGGHGRARPAGAGEDLLASAGFVGIQRVDVPCVWEFADPLAYARALSSMGPAYEAMQAIGEEAFTQSAIEIGRERVRDGLPLRAPIAVVGYVAWKPVRTRAGRVGRHGISGESSPDTGFLDVPREPTADAQRRYDDDLEEHGYVMNLSKLWAHQPTAQVGLFDLLGHAARGASLSLRQRGILVTACASTLGDAYCSLAWGKKLAAEAGADVAAGVLRGDDGPLDMSERALARWARRMTRDPNGTEAGDVQELRDAGYDDAQVLSITLFVALRIAFATVNDALGARPDHQLGISAPTSVRDAVMFGRPISGTEV